MTMNHTRLGDAALGKALLGAARQGFAGCGMVRPGLVWRGMAGQVLGRLLEEPTWLGPGCARRVMAPRRKSRRWQVSAARVMDGPGRARQGTAKPVTARLGAAWSG